MLNRYFIEVAYEGSAYHGWQLQNNGYTVQEELQEKLSLLLKHHVAVTGSGRTDSGVHCLSQFAHFDTPQTLDLDVFQLKANLFLSKQLAIKSVRAVKPNAHARFDAFRRTYLYRIAREKDPFSQNHAWQMFKELDMALMNQAGKLLLGKRDFEKFSKANSDVTHYRCNLETAEWQEVGSEFHFTIVSNRFLRGMVRLIVGALVNVGLGKFTLEEFEQILTGGMDDKKRVVAPAHGLYLTKVEYPKDIFLE